MCLDVNVVQGMVRHFFNAGDFVRAAALLNEAIVEHSSGSFGESAALFLSLARPLIHRHTGQHRQLLHYTPQVIQVADVLFQKKV